MPAEVQDLSVRTKDGDDGLAAPDAAVLASHIAFHAKVRRDAVLAVDASDVVDRQEWLACWVSITRIARKAKLWDLT
jgi:hypothetical protein